MKASYASDKKSLRRSSWRPRRYPGPKPGRRARYLLKLFAATPAGQDPRRQKLIASVLEDFACLARNDGLDTTK